MPLDQHVRDDIEALYGPDQADIHERQHDRLEQAWITFSLAKGQLDERRRDEIEDVNARHHDAVTEVHRAYEAECAAAREEAQAAGIIPMGVPPAQGVSDAIMRRTVPASVDEETGRAVASEPHFQPTE